jgi:two-component system nitrate/nitrite response regulator NarL
VIRILLIGDIPLHLTGLRELLARDPGLHVTTALATADGLARDASHADVVMVDTPGRDAVEPIRLLAQKGASIVALGVPVDERDAMALAEAGVLGFVERDASLDELVGSILSAARGEASFPPRIATALLHRVKSLAARRASADASTLTGRERQIVLLIEEGLSNKEIAARLFIEVATVKNHVHNILEKLQVGRRSDAVTRLRVIEGFGGSEPIRSTAG